MNDPATLPAVEIQGPEHRITDVNPAFCRMLSKTRESLVGQRFAAIAPEGDACAQALDRAQEAPGRIEGATGSGLGRWFLAQWPNPDALGGTMGVIIRGTSEETFVRHASAANEALLIAGLRQHELTAEAVALNAKLEREIAERKLVEAQLHVANERLADQAQQLAGLVEQRTGKLRETVSELEAFSYSVAHDMRAPLRGMQGFAQILLDEHSAELSAPARDYLQRIASSASRLDLLIRDVLNYTNLLRGEPLLRSVDLDRLLREITAVYPDWQSPKADIRIEGALPAVIAHEGFLTQCVSNLLSNAVKFVAPGVVPRVRIWAEIGPGTGSGLAQRPPAGAGETAPVDREPRVRIWFQDNGIGIAEKDRGRVFRMFERIHPADHFEGTGIGLTIVRRAIERMGGTVGFESELGAGSRFWIELRPATAAAAPESQ